MITSDRFNIWDKRTAARARSTLRKKDRGKCCLLSVAPVAIFSGIYRPWRIAKRKRIDKRHFLNPFSTKFQMKFAQFWVWTVARDQSKLTEFDKYSNWLPSWEFFLLKPKIWVPNPKLVAQCFLIWIDGKGMSFSITQIIKGDNRWQGFIKP